MVSSEFYDQSNLLLLYAKETFSGAGPIKADFSVSLSTMFLFDANDYTAKAHSAVSSV